MFRSTLFVLLLATPLWAAPPTADIPVKLVPQAGYVTLVPKTDAASITYVGQTRPAGDRDVLSPLPSQLLADKRTFLLPVRGIPDGEYQFTAVLAGKDGEQATVPFVVVIGSGSPPPVDPILPPTPLTPLQVKLVAAITADGAPATSVVKYAALFRAAATTTVRDKALTTSVTLLAEMQRAVKLLGIPPGSMNATARVVADAMNVVLNPPVALDDAARDKIAAEFLVIAAALEGVKK